MNEADWWKTLFDQKYLDTYLQDLGPERTTKEVDFVIKAAELKPEDRILDLACGHGRHAIELAERGFGNIVGLDYSEPFIKKAKIDAEQAGVFGYFDDENNQRVLHEISKVLKPRGKFLIDVISGDAVIRRYNKEGKKEDDSNLLVIPRKVEMGSVSVVDETEWFDPDKQLIHTHREWTDHHGEKHGYDYYLRVYTLDQYKEILPKAGFYIKQVWGDWDGNPPNESNYRTIILAEKR